ncbi:MAG: 3-oxoacyl-[acyl-carrier-protein] synthase 3 [Fimbriimonadales bacterium]
MPKRAVFCGLGAGIPDRVLSNADLEKLVDTSDEWIVTRTGIKERRIASPGEESSVLCVRAAREALEQAEMDPQEVDLIIVGTVTGETTFPSTACRVQRGLGIERCTAFDIGAACAGFVFGGAIASSLFSVGTHNTALVIGVELLSKITDYGDRSTCVLFGDGAGAAVLRAEEGDRGILASCLLTDGSGADLIQLSYGLPRKHLDGALETPIHGTITMQGQEVFRFAVKALADACLRSLEMAGLTPSDIDLFVPHQANLRIIRASMEKLELSEDRVFLNIEKYGNTSSASIPIALWEAERAGRIERGDIVLTVGFGAGLAWGANVIRW